MKKILLLFVLLLCNFPQAYANTGNIYIFVSFSMPKNSIKGWMSEAQKAGAVLVIRGLVNNSFKQTIQEISALTADNSGGLQLNPTLFERFQINKVPAVVVANDANCLPAQSCKIDYDTVYGDVTLSYALKKIADKQDSVSSIAEDALIKLRESHVA